MPTLLRRQAHVPSTALLPFAVQLARSSPGRPSESPYLSALVVLTTSVERIGVRRISLTHDGNTTAPRRLSLPRRSAPSPPVAAPGRRTTRLPALRNAGAAGRSVVRHPVQAVPAAEIAPHMHKLVPRRVRATTLRTFSILLVRPSLSFCGIHVAKTGSTRR
jgi:hypothetical protein